MSTITIPRETFDAMRDALEMLLSYTKACEGVLNCKPAGQIGIAESALTAAKVVQPQAHWVEPVAQIEITVRGSTTTIDNHFADVVNSWPEGVYQLYTTPQEPAAKQVPADALGFAIMEHLGPAALTGGKMSVNDAFVKGWEAAMLAAAPGGAS